MQIGHDRQNVTLNMGLENNAMFAQASPQVIADWMADFLASHDAGLRPETLVAVQIASPDDGANVTELTAVISYSAQDVTPATLGPVLEELCALTTQGCIAALIEDDESEEKAGFLTGPQSADYAPFDPFKFELGGINAGLWTFSNLRALEPA